MIDFSKLKKVKDDKKFAVLKHPKGHEVKVAKEALSPSLRAQLSKMPMHYEEGGAVNQPEFDPAQNASHMPHSQQPVINIINSPAGSSQMPPSSPAPMMMAQAPEVPQSPNYAYKIGSGLRGSVGDVAGVVQNVASPVKTAFNSFAQGLAGQEPEHSGKPSESPGFENMPLGSSGGLQGQQAQPFPMMNQDAMQANMDAQKQGMLQESEAMYRQGESQAKAAQVAQAHMAQQQKTYQDMFQGFQKEYGDLKNDYSKGHIDTGHYMDNMSTGKKITTAIGLILGGIGGALTHQENPAMKFLHDQIERDIKSQQANMDKQNNLLSYNMRQFGNMGDAVKMTQAMEMGLMSAKLQEAAGKAQGDVAKARAVQAASDFDNKAKIMMNEIAIKQALLSGGQQGSGIDPAIAVRYLVPKEEQAKAYEKADEAINHSQLKGKLMSAFSAASKDNTLSGRASRLGKSPASMAELENLILPLVHDAAGKVSDFELEQARHLFPAIGDTSQIIAEKKKALENFVDSKTSRSLLRAYGIKAPEAPTQRQTYNSLATRK